MSQRQSMDAVSSKSGINTAVLCFFLGLFGAHRFYVGRVKSGILMFLTIGGFGIWSLIDLIIILCNEFRDNDGRVIIFSEKGQTGKKLLAIVMLFLYFLIPFFAIGFALGIASKTVNPQMDVITAQLSAISKGNFEKAYFMTSKEFRQETNFETFKQFVENYPVIKNNDGTSSYKIELMEDSENYSSLMAVVHAKNGEDMQVGYQLVKEGGSWKILGIRVDAPESAASTAKADGESSEQAVETVSTKNLTYDDKAWHYSIKYPDNWYFEKSDEYSVTFSGKKGTPAYYSTVIIQVLPMKKDGGIYASVKDIVTDLKSQIAEKTTKINYLRNGEAELPTDTKNYTGDYFEVAYTFKNTQMQKLQFVILSPDGTKAYCWSYTASAERYSTDLPIAQAMYESWGIKK